MKQYLSVALTLACVALVVGLALVKQGDNARHDNDTASIVDFSNRLDSAQLQIAAGTGALIIMSNTLDACRAAVQTFATFSNQLTQAQTTLGLYADQITNLNRQVAELQSSNQTLQTVSDQRIVELTNQMAGYARQLALTRTNLAQASRDYGLLENRLRQDVAQRVMLERKFNNASELQAQIENLQWNEPQNVTDRSIYVGLDVQVNADGSFRVLAPN
jgi:chromosome segregation ATPase